MIILFIFMIIPILFITQNYLQATQYLSPLKSLLINVFGLNQNQIKTEDGVINIIEYGVKESLGRRALVQLLEISFQIS